MWCAARAGRSHTQEPSPAKVRLGLRLCGRHAGELALCPRLNSFFSNAPQPSAPSLVLMEVSALDQTSASVPQAGAGSTATLVSKTAPLAVRLGSPHPWLVPCPLQLPPLSGRC